MRAMTKGDLAFFYHSNCKVPGIVGVMEIVQEHSVDGMQLYVGVGDASPADILLESAFDPEHPYYDEKSSRENPKWHLVHVAFRQKFQEIIKLKELQKFSKEGGTLENMQALRRGRLSVSKVSKKEWNFILSLVDVDDAATIDLKQTERPVDHTTNPESQLPLGNRDQSKMQDDPKADQVGIVNGGTVEKPSTDLAPTKDTPISDAAA